VMVASIPKSNLLKDGSANLENYGYILVWRDGFGETCHILTTLHYILEHINLHNYCCENPEFCNLIKLNKLSWKLYAIHRRKE
jgi:hypothetical protein